MDARMEQELALLRRLFEDVVYDEAVRWIRIGTYPIPTTTPLWSAATTAVAFHVPVGYPATPPYSFWIPSSLKQGDAEPTGNVAAGPPFPGQWRQLSWQHEDGQWRPTVDLVSGCNLLNFTRTFVDRFREGR